MSSIARFVAAVNDRPKLLLDTVSKTGRSGSVSSSMLMARIAISGPILYVQLTFVSADRVVRVALGLLPADLMPSRVRLQR